MNVIKREISGVLEEMAQSFPAIALMGSRQCGKTTLAKSIFPDLPYVTLEDPDIRLAATNDPRYFLEQYEDGQMRVSDLADDGVFHPARVANRLVEKGRKGKMYEGRELIVASDKVKSPKRLRYLYSKPWVGSLYSGDSGLPLGPFEVNAVK